MPTTIEQKPINWRVLSLDGGGAKGVYTLGFLSRLEKDVGKPLCDYFDLFYGTSTGSLIATLLSLGHSVDEIYTFYLEHIPKILTPWMPVDFVRSRRLRRAVEVLLKGRTYGDLRKPTGIVATNWKTHEALVFKSFPSMAHSGVSAFQPGFGAPLGSALCASCSAVPLFRPVQICLSTRGGEQVPAYDGGFVANNPSVYAMIDAKQLGFVPEETVLFSVGVGRYPVAPLNTLPRMGLWLVQRIGAVRMIGGILEASSNSAEWVRQLTHKEVRCFRADQRFNFPELATDLLEGDERKLRAIFSRGTQTYQENESEIHRLL